MAAEVLGVPQAGLLLKVGPTGHHRFCQDVLRAHHSDSIPHADGYAQLLSAPQPSWATLLLAHEVSLDGLGLAVGSLLCIHDSNPVLLTQTPCKLEVQAEPNPTSHVSDCYQGIAASDLPLQCVRSIWGPSRLSLSADTAHAGREVRESMFHQVADLFHDLDMGMLPISVLFPYLPIPAHWARDR